MKTERTIQTLFLAALLTLTVTGIARAEETEDCKKAHKDCVQRANQFQIDCADPTSDCSKETRKAKRICEDQLLQCGQAAQVEAPPAY